MISKELVKQAVEEYNEESLSAIPTESECDHIFSERFEKNMKCVISKNNHPQLQRILRMAASFSLVICIAGASVLAMSPTARASVMGWLFGQEGDAYTYRSTGSEQNSDTITTYDFSEIPDGYTLWQNLLMPNSGLMIYSEETSGRLLKIFFAPNDGSGALYLIPEEAEKTTIPFGDTVADFYLPNSEESGSTIVWTDPENDYLVCVDGFFSQEELIEMARSLIKAEVPKPE